MAVSTTINRLSFAGNGSTTAFSFPYYFQSSADLVVVLRVDVTAVETTKTLTTHYTVAGTAVNNVYPNGGTVTMLTAPASGETLIIYKDPAVTQGVDLVENDSMPAESVEQALDKNTMLAQRLKDRLDRAVRLTDGFSPTFDTKLPSNLNEAADKVPLINATGDGFADCDDWPSSDDIADAQTNATAAAASAAAAATSETNAATSATSAASSAASALAQLNSAFFRDVVYITSADSPYTISSTHNGKLISCNTTGGSITVNLPSIAGLTLPFNVSFVKPISSNSLVLSRNGTDTIAGATSQTLTQVNAGCELAADTDSAPDDWAFLLFGEVPDSSITTVKIADANVTRAKLAVGAVGSGSVTGVQTTTYAISSSDDVVQVSGASSAWSATLPTAVGISGRRYTIVRTDQTLANVVTLATTSAQTIRGVTTYKLCTQYESVTVQSDGANWQIVNQYIPSIITSAGAFTVTGITSNPTKGTIVVDNVSWWREKNFANIVWSFEQNGGSPAAGSGGYLYAVPTGLVIATSLYPANTYAAAESVVDRTIPDSIPGSTAFVNNNSNRGMGVAVVYSTTQIRIAVWTDASTFTFHNSSNFAWNNASLGIGITVKVPITNWEY